MRLLFLLFIAGILFSSTADSQTCASTSRIPYEWPGHNNWGITSNLFSGNIYNFKTGAFTPFGDAFKPFQAYEGTSAASDDQGNLIFWTNGRQVIDKNGNETYNGLLTGNENGSTSNKGSASQGVITVRHPLNPNRYYIFTVDDALSGTKGLNYAVVDETGALVSGSARLGNFRTTEGITATFHENEVDIWIAVQESGSTNIHAFLLRCDGVVATPVTSTGAENCTSNEERGGIAFSWDGAHFVSAHPAAPGSKVIQFDFDRSTGMMSNPVGGAAGNKYPYDVTYAPDNSTILFSDNVGNVYSLSSPTAAPVTVATGGTGHSAIEIGADGNLYRASLGGSNFTRLSGNLNGGTALASTGNLVTTCSRGLPTMYIPPAEEPIITPVGPFCDTDAPVNLTTVWMCAGTNAEDTVNLPASVYTGTGIVYSGEGIFDPATAGPGLHEIIFTKCAVDDTIYIQVNSCQSCIDSLQNITPELCAGESMLIDTLLVEANGTGIWTIDSVPATAGVDAVLNEGVTDTIFNASNSNTKPGTYKLMYTVTFGNETCKDSVYVIVNPKPVVTVENDTICAGDPAAVFNAVATDAASYQWSVNGLGTSPSTSGTTAGDYTVIVTSNKACKDTATGTLIVNVKPDITIRDTTICAGDAAVNFDAGAGFTTYVWSENGTGTTQVTTGTTSGNYTAIVTDANGCKDTATAVLTVNDKPNITIRDTTICAGDAAVNFDAGAGYASYVWSENGTGTVQTTTGNTAGNYTAIATDANGCKDTATAVLTVYAKPDISIRDTAICAGDAAVSFDAGISFASYVWSENGTGTVQTTTGNAAGNYTAIVTDVNGCKDTATAVLTVNVKPDVSIRDTVICAGDAAVSFDVGAGFSAYEWSGNGAGMAQTASGNTPGNYTAIVTDSNGCKDTATAVLTENPKPSFTIRDTTICAGDAPVDFDAGTGFSSYIWSENGQGNAQTTSGNTAGNYTAIVTDASGCKDTATAILTVNAKPDISIRDTAICAGDAAVSFDAGAGFTSYVWSENGTGTAQSTTGNTAGNYTAIVTDVNGCKDTATAILTVSIKPDISVRDTTICAGDAPVNFDAGAGFSSYIWSENGTGIAQTTSGNTAGNYTVIVSDAAGCKDTATAVLSVNALPTVSIDDASVCPGATQTITPVVAGGQAPYTYVWSTGETTQTIDGGAGGNFSVTITDANTCAATDDAIVTINNNLTVVLNGPISICQGEDTLITSNYKTADGYTFSWTQNGTELTTNESYLANASGTYQLDVDRAGCAGTATVDVIVNQLPTVTVNDAAICDGAGAATFTATSTTATSWIWSDNGTGTNQTTSGTTAGDYTVIVQDVNGCADTATGVLAINQLPTVTVNDTAICEGDAPATFTATSTTATAWTWSENGTGTAQTTSGTAAGNYTVQVADANGCVATGTGVLTINLLPRVAVNDAAICEGDPAATFTASSATAVAWEWSANGTGTQQTTTGTTAGDYTVEITDDNGCKISGTGVLTVNALPVVGNAPASLCSGDPAVTIGETVLGGSYTYIWTTAPGGTSAQLSVTSGGLYTRVVRSSAGCESTSTYEVTENVRPTLILTSKTECAGVSMTLEDEGTVTGHSYAWTPGGYTSASITPTVSEDYTVVKTDDATGCSTTGTVSATFIAIPNLSINNGDSIFLCEGEQETVTLTHDAGSILWSTNATSEQITVSQTGEYSVIGSNGTCPAQDKVYVLVTQYPTSTLDKTVEDQLICFEAIDSAFVLTAGDPTSNYLWSTGETTNSITATGEGTYQVTISNRDCAIDDQVTLTAYCPWSLYVPNAFTPGTDALNNEFYAYGKNIVEFRMLIYDRWGLRVFESNDINVGWNGEYSGHPAQQDVYVYKIYYTVDTKTGSLKDYTKIGTVTLVR